MLRNEKQYVCIKPLKMNQHVNLKEIENFMKMQLANHYIEKEFE